MSQEQDSRRWLLALVPCFGNVSLGVSLHAAALHLTSARWWCFRGWHLQRVLLSTSFSWGEDKSTKTTGRPSLHGPWQGPRDLTWKKHYVEDAIFFSASEMGSRQGNDGSKRLWGSRQTHLLLLWHGTGRHFLFNMMSKLQLHDSLPKDQT